MDQPAVVHLLKTVARGFSDPTLKVVWPMDSRDFSLGPIVDLLLEVQVLCAVAAAAS